jgi:hypothetical protein
MQEASEGEKSPGGLFRSCPSLAKFFPVVVLTLYLIFSKVALTATF